MVQYIGIYFALGNKLNGLVLGVVNDEVPSYSECHNTSLRFVEAREFDCILQKVSCRFIESFDQSIAELVGFVKLLKHSDQLFSL
jgi:hypothetical protein